MPERAFLSWPPKNINGDKRIARFVKKSVTERKQVHVDMDSLNHILAFVEQYLAFNTSVRPTFDQEFEEAGAVIPSRLLAEIKVATKSLLTEPKRPQGKLVVVTGLGKSGKETQISDGSAFDGVTPLTKWLQDRSYSVMTTRVSYDSMIGGLLGLSLGRTGSNLLTEGDFDHQLTWVLRSMERALRSGRCADWLGKNDRNVLLAKGWTERDIVYGSVLGVEPSRILELERNALKPDYVVLLDAAAEAVRRRGGGLSRGRTDSDALVPTAAAFGRLSELYPFGKMHRVDANRNPKEVNASIIEFLTPLFG